VAMDFEGKKIVVIGGASGMGFKTAENVVAAGGSAVLVGRTGQKLDEVRRRFCDTGSRFAHNGVVFTGASSVAVTRYRYGYRGSVIATPWTPKPAAVASG
jgi:NAD(P)-dependent dehydrogenase (short-subunit alcohol dehydrogenase family)